VSGNRSEGTAFEWLGNRRIPRITSTALGTAGAGLAAVSPSPHVPAVPALQTRAPSSRTASQPATTQGRTFQSRHRPAGRRLGLPPIFVVIGWSPRPSMFAPPPLLWCPRGTLRSENARNHYRYSTTRIAAGQWNPILRNAGVGLLKAGVAGSNPAGGRQPVSAGQGLLAFLTFGPTATIPASGYPLGSREFDSHVPARPGRRRSPSGARTCPA
jgi:hypothetical protein